MIIHYLRKNNQVIVKDSGSYIQSSGPIRGVLVSTGPGKVGWSLWNEKAEIKAYCDTQSEFWSEHGMERGAAWLKAQKCAKKFVRFDKKQAIRMAVNRLEFPILSPVSSLSAPKFIHKYIRLMVERSVRYYWK